MKYSLFIGRWQPFHDGHRTLIQKVLDEGKNVCIACRMTDIDIENPFDYKEREKMIRHVFPDKERVLIMAIPDIEEVCYGRKVGWGIRELKLTKKMERISATKIRKDMGIC